MDGHTPQANTHLEWSNVGLGFAFIAFNAFVSHTLDLGVGRSLLAAALRCIIQLAVVALILQKVFASNNLWAVAGITGELYSANTLVLIGPTASNQQKLMKLLVTTVLLNFMGTCETGT